jgi:CO/xanthine dehydrogenase Mo-binding subunit
MNRATFDNQVHGGIAMGIGFTLTEERTLDARQTGKLCSRDWHDYRVPTALDVPPEIARQAGAAAMKGATPLAQDACKVRLFARG